MNTEPMTVGRFGEECAKMLPLSMRSERDPSRDTKQALAYRCTITANFASGAHAGPIRTFAAPYSTGLGNVDRWIKENLDSCAAATRAQTAPSHGLGFWGVSSKDAALLFNPECPNYQRSIDGAPKLAALRETYRPSLGEVLWAVFRDADGIEDYEDWVSWADDLGYFSRSIPNEARPYRIARIREAMASFEACRKAHFFLRAIFGQSYERLMSLSREV